MDGARHIRNMDLFRKLCMIEARMGSRNPPRGLAAPLLWWLWLLVEGAMAQPGRDCLALCPAGNFTCAVNCAQCDFDCCGSSCNGIRSGDVCNPTCFSATLNVSSCCMRPGTPPAPPPPPPPAVPSTPGPGNCSSVNVQPASGNLTLIVGVPFTFNISGGNCSAAVCGPCKGPFIGSASYFQVVVSDNSTGLTPPGTTCNVSAGSPSGVFPVSCLAQSSSVNAATKYVLTVSILSYGVWIPLTSRFLSIISGPVSVPACMATWANGTTAFIAGTQATLFIVQKDAFNNTVSNKTGRPDAYQFVFTVIYNSTLNSSLYNETFNVTYDIEEGIQTVSFYPRVSGRFYVQIGNRSQVIQRSPFRYDVVAGPVSMNDSIALWPSGINTFEAGSTAALSLFQVDQYGNNIVNFQLDLDVLFLDDNAHAPLDFNLSLQFSQYWSVSFIATVAGQYLVHVANGTIEIFNSPFTFSVVSGPVSVKNCIGSWLDGNSTVQAGGQATFLVMQMDAYNNNVSLATGSLDAFDFNASVHNVADGKLMPQSLLVLQPPEVGSAYRTLVYSPTKSGSFELYVGSPSDNVTGSPFSFRVLPGLINIPRCRASWTSGNKFVAGTNASLQILKVDRYNNSIFDDYDFVATLVSRSSDIPAGDLPDFNIQMQRKDAADYNVVTFVPTLAGKFAFVIGSSTESITNSPLLFTVNSSFISTPSCIATWPDQLTTFSAGSEATLDVTLKDIYNNTVSVANGGYDVSYRLSASVLSSPKGTQALSGLNVTIIDSSKVGRQSIKFYPIIAGQYWLSVGRLNESVASSPFPFTVIAGPISVSNCTATWRGGINTFQAGSEAVIEILLMDKFNNNVSIATGRNDSLLFDVQVIGYPDMQDWNMSMAPQNYSGYQSVVFYPPSTGNFLLQIGSNKINISGSAFRFSVQAGPLSIPDSSGQWPGGVQYAPQNGSIRFYIFPRDKYGNEIQASDISQDNFTAAIYNTDLTLLPVPDLMVSPFSNTSLVMTFSIGKVGKFILQVGNDTEDIAGSPFLFYVATDTVDPSRSIMEGDGLKNSIAGDKSTFLIQLRDSTGNPAAANVMDIDVQLLKDGVVMAVGTNITSIPKTSGVFQVTYKASVVGGYQLLVSWKGRLLGAGAPIFKSVLPAHIYGPWCTAKGAGVSGGVAGTILSFDIVVVDSYNNSNPVAQTVVNVTFSPPAKEIKTVTSLGAGKFHVDYNITRAQVYSLTVLAGEVVATEQVNGSPFRVVIQPGPLSIPNCVGVWKDNINYTSSGQKASFVILQRDKFDNSIYSTQNNATAGLFGGKVYNGSTISGSPLSIPDMGFELYTLTPSNWYELRFTIIPLGVYTLDAFSGSIKLKGTPATFSVVQEPPNATMTIISGDGLENSTVGQVSRVNITLRDQFNMPVVGNLQGYNTSFLMVTVAMVHSSVSQMAQVLENVSNRGEYEATYSTIIAGDYTILVTWKNVFLGLFNKTIFPAGPMLLEECNPGAQGGNGNISAYAALKYFNSRSFSYFITFQPFLTRWVGSGTLIASSASVTIAQHYSVSVVVETVATCRLHLRSCFHIDPGDRNSSSSMVTSEGVSGEGPSFLASVAKWNRIVMRRKDFRGELTYINTRLVAFNIRGSETCETPEIAVAGKSYSRSYEPSQEGNYMINVTYGEQLLPGSPLLLAEVPPLKWKVPVCTKVPPTFVTARIKSSACYAVVIVGGVMPRA